MISCESVIKKINELKSNKACAGGLDKVSSRLLRDAANIVAPSLTSLVDVSINTGCFPSTWKLAKISPLFKKGGKRGQQQAMFSAMMAQIQQQQQQQQNMKSHSWKITRKHELVSVKASLSH